MSNKYLLDALRFSESRYRRLFESARDGILLLNFDTAAIEDVNPYLMELLGYTYAEFIGKKVWEIGPFHNTRLSQKSFLELQEKGIIRYDDMPLESKNGEKIEVEFVSNVYECDGVKVIQCNIRDIRLRKKTEADRRMAAKVFDSSGEAMMITDADAYVISVNQAFTRLTGYTLEEVQGRNPRILASGKHDTNFYQAMWETLNNEGYWQGEIWDKHKEGHIYPKWMSISAVKDEHGQLSNYISIATDVTARKQAEQRIQFLAYFDVLTDLPNRTLLHDRLEQLVAASHRDNHKFALMFIDLDHFKYVNDSMGHEVGDELLKAVALHLQQCVREGDTVSRIGGDEFIVLLRETEAEGAASVAEKMLVLLSTPYDIGDLQITTHASIGISIYPDHGCDADTLTKQADIAMYYAKDKGRNNYQFFTPDMTLHANRIFSMEQDLRLAIQRNEFVLKYQPQVDMASGRICGVEALIRWQHPTLGVVMPTDFIPVAEETGQILAIGSWVLRTACAQLAAWRAQGLPLFPVAVNLSLRQLRQSSLAHQIESVLKENGLGPGDLELELTEGVTMGDTQMAMAFLLQMRQLGVLLSIDDFGTGYSSLNYLKKLPVDKLKIDQSFVSDIHEGNDAAIVRSIISLGHQFNLEVIAEGVETLEQLDFLHARGCDQIQGYYFSQPLQADEFMAFVHSNPSLGYSSSRLNRRKVSFPNTLRSTAFIERRVTKALPLYGTANNAG